MRSPGTATASTPLEPVLPERRSGACRASACGDSGRRGWDGAVTAALLGRVHRLIRLLPRLGQAPVRGPDADPAPSRYPGAARAAAPQRRGAGRAQVVRNCSPAAVCPRGEGRAQMCGDRVTGGQVRGGQLLGPGEVARSLPGRFRAEVPGDGQAPSVLDEWAPQTCVGPQEYPRRLGCRRDRDGPAATR